MNEKVTELEKLKLEAKALGIKSPHLYKSAETLRAVIEKHDNEGAMDAIRRKPAPKIIVKNTNVDHRTAHLNECMAKDPDSKYMFQPSTMSVKDIEKKGLEIVGDFDGDLVVRTDKKAFEEQEAQKNLDLRARMNSIDPKGQKIKSFDAVPKKPPQ
jgi:hypothetical protein